MKFKSYFISGLVTLLAAGCGEAEEHVIELVTEIGSPVTANFNSGFLKVMRESYLDAENVTLKIIPTYQTPDNRYTALLLRCFPNVASQLGYIDRVDLNSRSIKDDFIEGTKESGQHMQDTLRQILLDEELSQDEAEKCLNPDSDAWNNVEKHNQLGRSYFSGPISVPMVRIDGKQVKLFRGSSIRDMRKVLGESLEGN